MDVRIGVTYSVKEIELDMGEDADRDKVLADINAALADEAGVLWLTDKRGRTVGVPAAKVSYIEIGTQTVDRRVGFAG